MTDNTITNAELRVYVEKIVADIADLKTSLKEHDRVERDFQREYWQRHTKVAESAERAHFRIDDLVETIREIKDWHKKLGESITPLMHTNKIILFIGGALGLSVLALIWSLITGQAIIIFQ
jgi:hypothetical protein